MSISLFVLSEKENPVLPSGSYQGVSTGKLGLLHQAATSTMLAEEERTWAALFDEHQYLSIGGDGDITEAILNPASAARHGLLKPTSPGSPVILAARERRLPSQLRQYLYSSHHLYPDDLDLFLSLLSKKQQAVCSSLLAESFLQPPLFIAPQAFFRAYLEQLDQIVKQLHQRIPSNERTLARLVTMKGLATVLLQVHLAMSDLEVERCAMVQFEDMGMPLKRWKDDSYPIVFAANEKFAPALAVCINSMLAHCDGMKSYDIIVLESDITADSKARLQMLCSRHPLVLLRFFDPTALLSGYALQKNPTDHISMETYYRFLISDILPDYEKVAYLDCDTVILEDVSALFAYDVEGKVLAATLDAEIPAQRSSADPTMAAYLKGALDMEPSDPYLQAGVLLLNLKEMRSFHTVEQWLTLASARKYRYNDQDILNKECKGRFSILPMEWNVVVNCNNRRLPIIERGPYEIYSAYTEARKQPKIVHYAGFEKPWDAPYSDFAYLFWHYAVDSEFYERLLGMRQDGGEMRKRSGAMATLLPRGSRRRQWARRWYYTIFGR